MYCSISAMVAQMSLEQAGEKRKRIWEEEVEAKR
jgi:hypothetical protein